MPRAKGIALRDPEDVTKDELRELLGKGWLTHDGAWFFSVASEMGMDAANRLNKAAIRAMAPFETRRTMKVLQVDAADLRDTATLARFVTAGLGLIMPDSVLDNLHLELVDDHTIRWRWEPGRCFAYKSMKQMGQADTYECGVLFRIMCWLEAVEIPVELVPSPAGCLMHDTGECRGEFILSFPG